MELSGLATTSAGDRRDYLAESYVAINDAARSFFLGVSLSTNATVPAPCFSRALNIVSYPLFLVFLAVFVIAGKPITMKLSLAVFFFFRQFIPTHSGKFGHSFAIPGSPIIAEDQTACFAY